MADDTTSDMLGDSPEQPGAGTPAGEAAGSEHEPSTPSTEDVTPHGGDEPTPAWETRKPEAPSATPVSAPASTSGNPIPYFPSTTGVPAGQAAVDAGAPAGSDDQSADNGEEPSEPTPPPAKKGGMFGFLQRKKKPEPDTAQAPEGGSQPLASLPETTATSAPELGGAAAWAAAQSHGEEPAASQPAATTETSPELPIPPAPASVVMPSEKPGLFGFLKRKKTPEPEPGPWLPPEGTEAQGSSAGAWGASAAGVGAAAAGADAAAGPAASGAVPTAPGAPAFDPSMTQPSEPVQASSDAAAAAVVGGTAAVAATGAGAAGVAGLDPAASQMTQLLPTVPGPADATAVAPALPSAPAPVPAPLPAIGPMVPTGSRVVVVISRSASPVPLGPGVIVPGVLGQMQGDGLGQLQANGLSAQVFNDFSNQPRGEIIAQLPEGGQAAPAGSEVVLLVSSGPAPVASLLTALPDVVGLTEADALSKLQLAGLSPQIVRSYSATVPLGVVIDQLPSARSMAAVPKRKRSGLWWLWLVLALAVAAAVGGGVYYYLNRTAVVPRVVGLPQAQAEQAIAAAGFKVGSVGTTQTLSASQVGSVTSQTPDPEVTQKLTEPVDIVVSGGQLLFTVPNVVGKPVADAQNEIQAQGLTASVSQSYSATIPVGTVGFQSPSPGDKVPTKTTVGIVVSLGVQNVAVPSGLINQTQTAATEALKTVGLNAKVVKANDPAVPSGQVVSTSPGEGTSVPFGSTITLTVSKGPVMVTVPKVTGYSPATAITRLNDVGLAYQYTSSSISTWTVSAQSPSSGSSVPKGSSVSLTVTKP